MYFLPSKRGLRETASSERDRSSHQFVRSFYFLFQQREGINRVSKSVMMLLADSGQIAILAEHTFSPSLLLVLSLNTYLSSPFVFVNSVSCGAAAGSSNGGRIRASGPTTNEHLRAGSQEDDDLQIMVERTPSV